jgi:hypothetical protein
LRQELAGGQGCCGHGGEKDDEGGDRENDDPGPDPVSDGFAVVEPVQREGGDCGVGEGKCPESWCEAEVVGAENIVRPWSGPRRRCRCAEIKPYRMQHVEEKPAAAEVGAAVLAGGAPNGAGAENFVRAGHAAWAYS